jgi:metallo-beta-lactamase family protein
LRAQVEVINGYSAHADHAELASWIDTVREQSPTLREVWLVHGEPDAQDALAATISSTGLRVHTPLPGNHAAL